jgi:DivIVA domain-containing protein
MAKKDRATDQPDQGFAPPATPSPARTMLGPMDIQQKEFRVSRFGGYKMRDVDEFLDQVTESMSALIAEHDRQRATAAGPIVASADLDDVNRQADEIIQRARAEAMRIVAEAKMSVAGGPSFGDRAAVNAFLAKERSFLQSLANLVQGHAESVKGMAKASRTAATSASPADGATPIVVEEEPPSPASEPDAAQPAASERAAPAATSTTDASTAAASEREAPSQPEERPQSEPEQTVRIDEPEPAVVARSDRDDDPDGEGDLSLRELFWGED